MALPPVSLEPKRQRRRGPAIPKEICGEVAQFAYGLARRYRNQFTPELKAKVLRLLRALLPPRRKRGRPRDPMITRATMSEQRFRRKYPQESRYEIWNRVCLRLIPGYAAMSEFEQRAAREDLQAQVKWRFDLTRSRRKRQRKNRV
jgi:hypothetical protein